MEAKTQAKGFYGWWLLFFLWIVYTIPIGFAFYSPVVLYPFMIGDMGWSRGETMVGFTAMLLFMGITGPFTAWMIGRFGARLTMSIGGLIIAVATFLLGLAGHIYPIYLVLCLFTGLGLSLASMIPVQTVVISWFSARRALALGHLPHPRWLDGTRCSKDARLLASDCSCSGDFLPVADS